MEIRSGTFVKVINNFESDINGDLNLIEGDIVQVKSVVNSEWLEGTFGDDIGIFPSSHCIALKLAPTADPFGVALYSHEAHLNDELSFEAGDQVFFTSKVNLEWYNGICQGRRGMFPVSYVSIVQDLPVAPVRPVAPQNMPPKTPAVPEVPIPERPKSLDATTIATLRSKSVSKRNAVHPSEDSELPKSFMKTPPSLQPPSFPPPSPPTRPTSAIADNNDNLKGSPPQRPPLAARHSFPSRPAPLDITFLNKPEPEENFKTPQNNTDEVKVPSRPPPLDNVTVSVLRERSKSQGKRSKDKSPSRPPSTYLETSPEKNSMLSHLPDQDDTSNRSELEAAVPDSPKFTQVSHPGLLDWNVEDRPVYVEDPTNCEKNGSHEALYANAADIQAVEEEYKTTALEDAALKKIHKSITEKEKMLAAEKESKIQTEDLLAQQFSGKKIDKESVELLRSLLNAHNEKIAELCNKIDSMKAKARSLKSPAQKSDKLDGIERRDKVVIELIETEESNLRELKVCISGFLHTLRNDNTHTMDIDMMFLNIENVALVAEKLLMMLKGQQTLMSHEQMIGRCFTHLEEDLHREYTFYLENQASVMELIAQYQKDKANKELLDSCLQKIRQETTCWDLNSFLIRPVQRIMKYPLFLRDMLVNTPAHWTDRPFLVSATEIVDNIVVYANENKRKDELIKRYNEEVADSSLLPKLTLHSLKKKSKRLTTTLTHSLNITSSVVEDSTFAQLSEKFSSLVLIIKTLIREATTFTDLLKKVQAEMDDLCTNIHNFYDNLESQRNVFLYHGAALKIAQNYTPRFIKDLEEGPLGTLSDLLAVFTAPQYFIDKRNSKILDYDNLSTQAADGSTASENLKIARGEFEALNKQLLDDLPILIHEGAEVVKKSSYSVLALFCQYSHACHDEFRRALDKMSLELNDPPDSIHLYHVERMKTCCSTLLTISSFDKEVTQAIVLGSTMKPTTSKFYESEVCEDEQQPATCTTYDVNKWLESQPDDLTAITSDEEEAEEEMFEKPGTIENAQTGTICRVLYDFAATSDTMVNVQAGDTVTLVADCLISDTWVYVKAGDERGYAPKSYLTLSGTLKNKPAPLPPSSKSAQEKGKSIKRRAPPPPQRTVSEVSIPTVRQPVAVVSPEPEPAPQPTRTYTTVDKKTRPQPKRSAPPPPMSRRNTAPVLSHRDRTIEQISNLEDTSDSSGGGILSTLPESRVEGFEETPDRTEASENRDVLELSSNLDEVDLLGSYSARKQEAPSVQIEPSYANIPTSTPSEPVFAGPPIVSELNTPNPVPVPIPLKRSLPPRPDSPQSENEPYYEVIDSETSSEYDSLPPPPSEVLVPIEIIESEEVISSPVEVFLSPAQSFSEPFENVVPDGSPLKPNNVTKPSCDQASSEDVFKDDNPTNEFPPPDISPVSVTVSQDNPSYQPVSPSAPPNINSRSSSVSVTSTPSNSSITQPAVSRSASVSVPSSTAKTSGASVSSARSPAASRNTGPAIPSSPLPKQPLKSKEKKSSPMFDECPMEMSMVRKQELTRNYEAQYNYRARSPAELSLSARQVVSVVDSSHQEWWYVKAGRRQGFVPANFLRSKS
ncbi:hypothetical protein ACHWQZ_G004290 [Mnemiopsis leidyi]